jgi:hypothetical protein
MSFLKLTIVERSIQSIENKIQACSKLGFFREGHTFIILERDAKRLYGQRIYKRLTPLEDPNPKTDPNPMVISI